METIDIISKLLDSKAVLGNKVQISDNLYIIPVYKVKAMFLNLKTGHIENDGLSNNGSISVSPIVLLKVSGNEISLISLDEKKQALDFIPDVISNIDINNLFDILKK